MEAERGRSASVDDRVVQLDPVREPLDRPAAVFKTHASSVDEQRIMRRIDLMWVAPQPSSATSSHRMVTTSAMKVPSGRSDDRSGDRDWRTALLAVT